MTSKSVSVLLLQSKNTVTFRSSPNQTRLRKGRFSYKSEKKKPIFFLCNKIHFYIFQSQTAFIVLSPSQSSDQLLLGRGRDTFGQETKKTAYQVNWYLTSRMEHWKIRNLQFILVFELWTPFLFFSGGPTVIDWKKRLDSLTILFSKLPYKFKKKGACPETEKKTVKTTVKQGRLKTRTEFKTKTRNRTQKKKLKRVK